jgi:hypothetical protein
MTSVNVKDDGKLKGEMKLIAVEFREFDEDGIIRCESFDRCHL